MNTDNSDNNKNSDNTILTTKIRINEKKNLFSFFNFLFTYLSLLLSDILKMQHKKKNRLATSVFMQQVAWKGKLLFQ